jgi:carboxymethylenebutenolidase
MSTTPKSTHRIEQITAVDGGTFAAYCAVPESGKGPGIMLFQEIFGVNDNMRGLADRLAGEGYVVLVPDMFWRLQPGFESKDESGMQEAFGLMMRFDAEVGQSDLNAVHRHLLALPECTGKIGASGFCFGGGLAFAAAATSRVDGRGIDASIPYYGSAVHSMLGMADQATCPLMFHYGANDPYIPTEQIDDVEKAFAGRADVEFYRYDAGHAFSNFDAPSMYNKEVADVAWARTLGFFAKHLS